MLIGVASVPRYDSTSKERYPERFPIAVGIAYLETGNFQTLLVKPPVSWGLIKLETEQERIERKRKKKRRRVQILAHITDGELSKKGQPPEEVAEIVLILTEKQVVYSLERKHDKEMLNKLSSKVAGKIDLLSTLALASEFTARERAVSLQLQCKLSIGLYPKNNADIRWILPWIKLCKMG